MKATVTQDFPYFLGHSNQELERLIHQGRFLSVVTEQVLCLAGLESGMQVLDVGCGVGDVSFLAAKLVGPTGKVIGVDQSPTAIALASQRAAQAGVTNVYFLTQDLTELTLDEPVDALIGRLVLMYFVDPAVLLRRLAGFLKPDGLVIFQELNAHGAKSEPVCDLFETTVARITQTCTRSGADVQTGLKLARIFQEAGLPRPQMIQGARVENGPDSEVYSAITQLTRTLLPLMERTGVATAAEVNIDTLADRLREEAVAINATWIYPPFIGAWARKELD